MSTQSRARVARAAALAAVALAVVTAVAVTRADVDLWGHVRFGEDILDTGRIDRVDPYSFTSDRPWVNHEWLAEAVFASAWRAGGSAALVAVKLACAFGALGAIALVIRRRGLAPAAAIPLLALALVGILQRTTHVRPQLFSVILFAALLYVLDRSTRTPAWLLAAAPIMILWANAHGGWIVGLATVGMWTAGLAWQRRREGPRALAVLVYAALAAAATLVNPYGPGLWAFLLETVRFGREAIAEWGPLWSNPPMLMIWLILASVAASAIGRAPASNPARVLIPIVWGAAALRVSRLDAFFALSAVALLAPHSRWIGVLTSRPRTARPSRLQVLAAAAVWLAALAVPAVRRPYTCIQVYAPWWPEPAAVEFLGRQPPGTRVVTYFRWGEYAIWHLADRIKVSMDGRRETVYTDRVLDAHLRVYEGNPGSASIVEELAPDLVWLPREFPAIRLLEAASWHRVLDGPQSVVLSRRPSPASTAGLGARPRPMPPSRCFPGP